MNEILFQTAMAAEEATDQNKAVLAHLVKLSAQVGEVSSELARTREDLHRRTDEAEQQISDLKHAFPADDPAGHRAYHDEVIAIARARKEFWQKLLFELAKWGLLGFVGWMVVAGWRDFLRGPN